MLGRRATPGPADFIIALDMSLPRTFLNPASSDDVNGMVLGHVVVPMEDTVLPPKPLIEMPPRISFCTLLAPLLFTSLPSWSASVDCFVFVYEYKQETIQLE
jgi:hypothetical protein